MKLEATDDQAKDLWYILSDYLLGKGPDNERAVRMQELRKQVAPVKERMMAEKLRGTPFEAFCNLP